MRFESLISELSSKFINLPGSELDGEITAGLKQVCDCLDISLSTLWQMNSATDSLQLTHYHRKFEGPSAPENMDGRVHFPWIYRQVMAGKIVALDSVDDLPPEAATDAANLRYHNIKSSLDFPMSVGGNRVFGSISYDEVRGERMWPEALVARLKLTAQVFANALVRRNQEDAQKLSEARLAMAAKSANIGLWSLDIATKCYWMTQEAAALIGLAEPIDLPQEEFLLTIHPDDRGVVRSMLQHIVEHGSEGSVEFRVPQPDGGVRWLVARGRFQPTGPKTGACVMGVSADITERKAAEHRMREHQTRMAAAIEVADLAFYELNLGNRVEFYDDRMQRLLGYQPGLGINVREFWINHLHPDDRERVKGLSRELLEGRSSTVSTEYHYLHPEHGLRWLAHVSKVVEKSESGAVLRLTGVIRDITQQRQAEIEQQQHRNEIAHLARVAMVGELSGSLAHELNQPLTAILSNAQAALNFLNVEKPNLTLVREILQDIITDDLHAGNVIRRLRSLLKRDEVKLHRVDINEVVREILPLIRSDLLNHRVFLDVEYAAGLPPVHGDTVQLHQVLINLIVNASDAMDQCDVHDRRLSIRTSRVGEQVCVAISDCGAGIAPEVQAREFEPFVSTKPNGLGLGLAVSRTIISAHGGKLMGRNNPDRGATFWFELPIVPGV